MLDTLRQVNLTVITVPGRSFHTRSLNRLHEILASEQWWFYSLSWASRPHQDWLGGYHSPPTTKEREDEQQNRFVNSQVSVCEIHCKLIQANWMYNGQSRSRRRKKPHRQFISNLSREKAKRERNVAPNYCNSRCALLKIIPHWSRQFGLGWVLKYGSCWVKLFVNIKIQMNWTR